MVRDRRKPAETEIPGEVSRITVEDVRCLIE